MDILDTEQKKNIDKEKKSGRQNNLLDRRQTHFAMLSNVMPESAVMVRPRHLKEYILPVLECKWRTLSLFPFTVNDEDGEKRNQTSSLAIVASMKSQLVLIERGVPALANEQKARFSEQQCHVVLFANQNNKQNKNT